MIIKIVTFDFSKKNLVFLSMWDLQSDKLDYLKESLANFFSKFKSMHLSSNKIKQFGFGVHLLNLMASAVKGVGNSCSL